MLHQSRIACLRIPKFQIVAHQKDEPALKGKPLVIINGSGSRAQVLICSKEAGKERVYAGMRLSEARAVCANLLWREYNEPLYQLLQQDLLRKLVAVSPKISALEPGIFLLDASGMNRLGGEEKFSRRVQKLIVSEGFFDVHTGIADSAFCALVASKFKKESYFIVPPGEDKEFLSLLSVSHLPRDLNISDTLLSLGIKTMGQLIRLPLEEIIERFGTAGVRAYELAGGIDTRFPETVRIPHEFEAAVELGFPVESLQQTQFILKSLLVRLTQQLKESNLLCNALLLTFYNDNDPFEQRPIKLIRPSNSPVFLLELIKLSLEAQKLCREFTGIKIQVGSFSNETFKQNQFGIKQYLSSKEISSAQPVTAHHIGTVEVGNQPEDTSSTAQPEVTITEAKVAVEEPTQLKCADSVHYSGSAVQTEDARSASATGAKAAAAATAAATAAVEATGNAADGSPEDGSKKGGARTDSKRKRNNSTKAGTAKSGRASQGTAAGKTRANSSNSNPVSHSTAVCSTKFDDTQQLHISCLTDQFVQGSATLEANQLSRCNLQSSSVYLSASTAVLPDVSDTGGNPSLMSTSRASRTEYDGISEEDRSAETQFVLDNNVDQEEPISLLLQRFISRLGLSALVRSVPNDQHLPDKAGVWMPVGEESAESILPFDASYPAGSPFPCGLVLKKLPLPEPVLVEYQGHLPRAVTYMGKWYRIKELTEPEKLSGLWWEKPVCKSYYVALIEAQERGIEMLSRNGTLRVQRECEGLLVLLVHDHGGSSWQIEGFFD